MKPFIRFLVGIMLLPYCFSGCTHEELFGEEAPILIRLAVEETTVTRAPVTGISAANISSVGIYGVKEATTSGQFPWTTTPFASNLVPTGITGSQLSFASRLYYPMGGKRVIFYGYYPRTTATSGANYVTVPGNGTPPVLNFTLTGQEDIMQAVSTPSGSANPATAALNFNHKLTQIILNVPLLSGILSGIKITGVKNQGSMNIETGVVQYGSSTADFPLTVVGLLPASTMAVMVPAGVSSYTVVVEVTVLVTLIKNTYIIKPTTGNFLPGVIYTISL